jgi:hypothetical protein
MFSPVFPLAPFFSLICNFMEIKSFMNSLAYNNKRSVAFSASGIGSWSKILSFLALISIPVNCGLIFYTAESLPELINKEGDTYHDLYYLLGFTVFLEHIIIALKMII